VADTELELISGANFHRRRLGEVLRLEGDPFVDVEAVAIGLVGFPGVAEIWGPAGETAAMRPFATAISLIEPSANLALVNSVSIIVTRRLPAGMATEFILAPGLWQGF
jgi:hypothetical protein